ncbi:MAG TPA: MFS transporter [Chitinophagaceae bacterium]
MLRVISRNIYGLKNPIYAASALALASFGDAFLYPFLPQYAEVLNVPVVWVGLLLSINRFIRIAFNPVVVRLFAKYGVRKITILASVLAVISTMGYGLGWGLMSLIFFRIVWGMAFAILRISSMAYAFENGQAGMSLGIAKSVQETGPLLALWLGPVLLNNFDAGNTFFILAVISLPAVFYASALPDLKYVPATAKTIIFRLPSLFNSMTFTVSFVVEGILVVVIGLFLSANNIAESSITITALAAAYLAFRRVCFILFSPVSGLIADRVGFIKVFNASMLMIIFGLILLLSGWVSIGLIIIFAFNSINSTMAPGGASGNETDKIRAVALNATWRDIGAAAGALAGGFLLSASFLFESFIFATFILAVLLFFHYRQTKKA